MQDIVRVQSVETKTTVFISYSTERSIGADCGNGSIHCSEPKGGSSGKAPKHHCKRRSLHDAGRHRPRPRRVDQSAARALLFHRFAKHTIPPWAGPVTLFRAEIQPPNVRGNSAKVAPNFIRLAAIGAVAPTANRAMGTLRQGRARHSYPGCRPPTGAARLAARKRSATPLDTLLRTDHPSWCKRPQRHRHGQDNRTDSYTCRNDTC